MGPKLIERDRGHFILIKEKPHQDDLLILNIYAPYVRAAMFMKEILLNLKSHIDPHILIVENFNNGQIIQTETRQRNTGVNRHYEPNIANKYLQNTLQKHKRIQILLSTSLSILQNWKEPRCPSTEEWIQKIWYIYTMEYY